MSAVMDWSEMNHLIRLAVNEMRAQGVPVTPARVERVAQAVNGARAPQPVAQAIADLQKTVEHLSQRLDERARRIFGITSLQPRAGDTVHPAQLAGVFLTPATRDTPGELVGVLQQPRAEPRYLDPVPPTAA